MFQMAIFQFVWPVKIRPLKWIKGCTMKIDKVFDIIFPSKEIMWPVKKMEQQKESMAGGRWEDDKTAI